MKLKCKVCNNTKDFLKVKEVAKWNAKSKSWVVIREPREIILCADFTDIDGIAIMEK